MKSILIKNVSLISMSESREKVEHDIDIEIRDGKIFNIGKNLSCHDAMVIDGNGKVIIPGFINTHAHIPMSLFRNSVDGLKLEDWLSNFIWPIEDRLTDEEIYSATLLSAIEMVENGITTVHDLYFRYDQIIPAVKEVGLDLIVSRTLMNQDNCGEQRILDALKLMNEYKDVKFTLGIHGLYTSDEEYIKRVTDLAKEKNMPVHMHFCETDTEVATIKERYNVSHPGEVLKKHFQGLKCILAHGVKLDGYDMDAISKMNISISHCPVSNLMLGCGIADTTKMQGMGINVTIGTDGQGSGNKVSILEAMRIAALLQKGSKENPLLMPAYEVLKMATINGAKALGLEEEIGSIEVGKRANLVVFDFKEVSNYPINNYIANIVYNANSSDIETVLIDGDIVMNNKKFKVNREDIIKKCEEIVNKVFN